MGDRYRTQKCSRCHVQLLVPPEAQSIRCAVCHSITQVQPYDLRARAFNSANHAAGILGGLVSNISSSVNSLTGTTNSGYPAQCTQNCSYYYPPQPLLPAGNGRKRALLCGVSYRGKSYALKGTVNDVRCMRYFLKEKMGFPGESILTLTGNFI